MNIQFERVVKGHVVTYTSQDFPAVSDDRLKAFIDWCGSDGADRETFWSVDMRDNDTVNIDFAHWPRDPQRLVYLFASKLGISLAPFSAWIEALEEG